MFFKGFGEDEDIIEVDQDFSLEDKVVENVVHQILKCTWRIGQPKKHHSGFEQTKIGVEHHFPLITLLGSHIVIAPPYIKFGEVLCTLEFVDQLGNEGKGVPVFDSTVIALSLLQSWTGWSFPSFFFTKKKSEAKGDFDGECVPSVDFP